MSKDLTNSAIDRQNILNNPYALAEIEKAAGIQGIVFEGKTVVLKEQVAAFFEVTPRTIDNYIEKCGEELRQNGYEVLKGNRLKTLKLSLEESPDHESSFVTKTTALGVFDFRSFLNLAMLVSESERAKLLRQVILDIVIDTINSRTGGGTKYINQRDEDFLNSAFVEENYRKQFTDALKDCVAMGNFKYAVYTDKIYLSINAIIHNNYSNEVPPKFELFADRLEITSAGGLPAGFDEEEFFMGYSVPQNKELMRVFRDLDMVEQLGSGVPRILAHYPRTVYQFTPNFIRLVLPYTEGFDQATDQADALLQFCITPRSTKEMMQHLGLSHHPHFRNRLLLPLIASGKLALTIPDKPSSPKQRYVAIVKK